MMHSTAISISIAALVTVSHAAHVPMRAPAPPPSPLPPMSWEPQYSMGLSTIANPDGNYTGFDQGQTLELFAKYGIIVFDGNFQMCINTQDGPAGDFCKYKNTAAAAEEQARNIKALSPKTRVFTYHNQEEALLRNMQDCLIMNDPTKSDWFIRNNTAIVNNKKILGPTQRCADFPNASYTHEDQYALNFSNPVVSDWWFTNVIEEFLKSDVLDGFYWDCPSLTSPFSDSMTQDEIDSVNADMAAVRAKAQPILAAASKWGLDMFSPLRTPDDCPTECALGWRTNCSNLCDRTPAKCISALQNNVKNAQTPSIMYIPYVGAGDRLMESTCAAGPSSVNTFTPGSDPATLSCMPGTGALNVEFASYGTPTLASSTGRFIQCKGSGCKLSDTYGRGTSYWEDLKSKIKYEVRTGASCDQESQRNVTMVDASYFFSLETAAEAFSCARFRDCKDFAADPTCDAGPEVLQKIKSMCDGKQSCRLNLTAADFPPLPAGCYGTGEQLAVYASGCQQGQNAGYFREQLAGFLLSRGPHSWFGYNWIASAHPLWEAEWDVDYGEPLGDMEVNGMVATRKWSNFDISLDCSTFTATFNKTAQ